VHFLALIWNVNFVLYFTYLMTAGVIANWYFTPRTGARGSPKKRGEGKDELSNYPVWSSVKRTFWCHLGTVAFASLIVGICEFLRDSILWLANKLKGEHPGRCRRCLIACVACPLNCVTCCLEKVSKHAIVWTAIWGDGFIVSCCSSFKLIWDNLDRVAAITIVSGFIMLLGKVLVALLVTGVAGLIMQAVYGTEITSIIMPCVVTFILCFAVATLFMGMFEVTLDCLFLCFLVDEYNFGGTDQMYADPGLESVVNRFQDKSQIRARELRAHGNVHKGGVVESKDGATGTAAAGTAAAGASGTAAATASGTAAATATGTAAPAAASAPNAV